MLFPKGYIKRGVEQNAKLHYSYPPPPEFPSKHS